MRQREAQLGAVDESARQQDVAEAAAGAVLLGQRVVQRVACEDAALDELLAEPAQAGFFVRDRGVHGARRPFRGSGWAGASAQGRERVRR